MKIIPIVFGILLGFWVLPFAVLASPVTFSFEGEGTGSTVGSSISGKFGYDATAPELTGDSNFGFYGKTGFFVGTILGGPQNGGFFEQLGVFVTVTNQPTEDGFGISNFNGNFISLMGGQNIFNSTALPTTINLRKFSIAQIFLLTNGLTGGSFQPNFLQGGYNITSIQPDSSAVPEPSTIWLFSIGFVGLYGFRRYRHR